MMAMVTGEKKNLTLNSNIMEISLTYNSEAVNISIKYDSSVIENPWFGGPNNDVNNQYNRFTYYIACPSSTGPCVEGESIITKTGSTCSSQCVCKKGFWGQHCDSKWVLFILINCLVMSTCNLNKQKRVNFSKSQFSNFSNFTYQDTGCYGK